MIPAGRYDFGLGDVGDSNHGLELDAQFVDLVGATGVREEVILTSAIAVASRGTVEQTADDVKISGLTMGITSASSTGSGATEAAAYFPTTALANAVLSDVVCQSETTGVLSMRPMSNTLEPIRGSQVVAELRRSAAQQVEHSPIA